MTVRADPLQNESQAPWLTALVNDPCISVDVVATQVLAHMDLLSEDELVGLLDALGLRVLKQRRHSLLQRPVQYSWPAHASA
jgi:hypothetical protein